MKKGFTLIELLVVVLIIGILSAVALPQYEKAVEKARAAHGITYVKNIRDAEERYFLANNEYTCDLTKLDLEQACPKDFDCRCYDNDAVQAARASKGYSITTGFSRRSNQILGTKIYCVAAHSGGDAFCRSYSSEPIDDFDDGLKRYEIK